MYPAEDLQKLELRKLRARLSILVHRQQCAAAGRNFNRTAETLEEWRQRAAQWSGMLKFAPGIFGIIRGLKGWAGRRASSPAAAGFRRPGKISTVVQWLTTGLKAYNTFRRK